ncbi:hypothetical protein B6A42_26685 (plasmid) [Vibrio coralliilyticus]|nr:hypothetical protein B6A42_26685 [Vibrio coralliilyticus]
MSQNCQALVVRLNAWLWKVEATNTLTAQLQLFVTTKPNKPHAATPKSLKKKPNNNDTAN